MNTAHAKFQELKQLREKERANAIRDGFLADPDKKTSLDKAITPVGTCLEMCPEFERVERIVQNMVDKAEKVDGLILWGGWTTADNGDAGSR
ncbi:actin cytoskeleton and mitosis protein [Exophiala dermatitidis]|nr:actin cytoskeleton and mitosis protein [Exophiala dermatitidis]